MERVMSKKAFEDDELSSSSKVEIKKPITKSMFDNQAKKPDPIKSKEQAAEVNTRLNDYNSRAIEGANVFRKLLDDRTIVSNKSIFAAGLEKEAITKLQQLALDMDADPVQPDGMGSVGLISLALNALLAQRDKINQLDYNIHQLENKIKQISSALDKPQQEK